MGCHRSLLIFSLVLALLACGASAHADPSGVAVIIGNRHYKDGVPEVSYAHRDAEAFKRYVLDALGYDPANVLDLRDATQAQMVATFGNEKSAEGNLWAYLDPAGGSDVVVFYSGHGVPSQRDGKGYLLPADADPNVPELNAYPIDLLYANLAKLTEASAVRVFLDACFSGGSQRGKLIEDASPVFVPAALPTAVAGTMTVLTAASDGQLASWDTSARHGMFTHHLLDALYGSGDADGDGRVSAAEAKRYLDKHMTRAARYAYKRNQVASLLGDGEVALAFSGETGFRSRPALGPGDVSAVDIDEMDGVLWARQRTNLRAGPSTEHPVAGSLKAGQEVVLKGRVRDAEWLLVSPGEGNDAFVYAPLLDDRPPSASPTSVPPSSAPVRDTAQETVFWESVEGGDATGFEAYLKQYPNGAFSPLAIARLRPLVWTPIENSGDARTFEEFLAANPDSHFAEAARAALRQRIGEADKRTLDGYLADYPQGVAADLARERLPAAAYEKLRDNDLPRVFEEYLADFPDSQFAEEVRAALRERIEHADKTMLDRYLARYSQGTAADLARGRLPAATWESIRNSGQPRVLEEFLAAYPESGFTEPARATLRRLIQQASKAELNRYLDRYPQGAAANLARERLPAAEWQRIRHNRDFRSFSRYLKEYPRSAYIPQAQRRLRDTIKQSSDVYELQKFVGEEPASAFADEARKRLAILAWRKVANSIRTSDFDGFLRQFPNSHEASLARDARAKLPQRLAPFVEKDGIWVGRDCRKCPEMVVVPAGSYRMGSAKGQKDERPVHQVTIGAPFAVGKYEVTFAQWDACARARGCPRGEDIAKDDDWGRRQRPVIHVSWGDAQRYVQWLSRKTKKPYRLLSESEWEYAARAGTSTAYSWGTGIGVGLANCRGCSPDHKLMGATSAFTRALLGVEIKDQTVPVGSFAANAWGLHDMHGNVWEWVEDCWNSSYTGAPKDGGAWESGECSLRVLRGGSWYNGPSILRAADRFWYTTGIRNNILGFRVARTLTP